MTFPRECYYICDFTTGEYRPDAVGGNGGGTKREVDKTTITYGLNRGHLKFDKSVRLANNVIAHYYSFYG